MKYLMIVFLFLFIASTVEADSIPGGYHTVFRSVILNNLDQYPDLTFIGRIKGVMTNYSYIITNNVPLEKGYKFNYFYLYAVSNSVLAEKGGIDKLIYPLTNVNIIDPGFYIIKDDSALTNERIIFSIMGFSNQNIVLKMIQRKLDFKDGFPSVISNY
jgi:hypothetical protein